MATVDQELHAMTRYLLDAAYDFSFLGPNDEGFLGELEYKVGAIQAELGSMLDRVRRDLPVGELAAEER